MIRRVILIDDDAAVLESLEAVFWAADYEVQAFGSAIAFVAALPGLSPACIITDLRMPEMDGLALVTLMRGELGLSWPIIVISGHADVPEAVGAMQAGACDFLIKPFAPQRLLTVVNTCLAAHPDEPVLAESDVDQRYMTLTQRERQVVEFLASGGSSKTVGLALGISPRTVDVFRGRAMRKMGVANIAALATAVATVSPDIRDDLRTTW